jgi:hypothetical protein
VIVLVSDTSVLIDLERGDFIDACFRIDATEFVVPDLLYRRELAEYGGSRLIDRGLRVVGLSPDELLLVQEVRQGRPRLSLVDAYAFSLASSRRWTLLSGDAELRSVAAGQKVPCFGLLWMLDRLFDGGFVAGARMVDGLQRIADHPRCRLPRSEVQLRMSRYSAK